MDFWSDEIMALWVPIAVYWAQSTAFELLMRLEIPFFEKYRIHTSDERQKRNRVSFEWVLVMVVFQQIVQIVLGYALLKEADPAKQHRKDADLAARTLRILVPLLGKTRLTETIAGLVQTAIIPAARFMAAMFIIDTHQYILHRLAHTYKFLYKHFHSHHHRLYVPYAFGALYNHPVEGFLLDTCGAALAYELTGMTPRLGMLLFTFSNIKTINDHCGYAFPWDPLNVCFGNNVVYHDIHHQIWGIKHNFGQPFFTFWDRLLRTEFDQSKLHVRKEKGTQAH